LIAHLFQPVHGPFSQRSRVSSDRSFTRAFGTRRPPVQRRDQLAERTGDFTET
jgi:hypothetical protein